MSLNDLFVQILQSEQKAKERKNLLNEVKNEIAKVQEQLKDIQEECISTKGQLVVKLQHQTEAELSLTWLRHREGILTDQLARVTKNREASAQDLKSLEAAQAKKHEDFIQEIASFNQTYDLCGGGREQREAEARQQLQELKQQEQQLMAELADCRKTQAMRNRLNAEKMELKTEVDKLQSILEGLHKKLQQEKAVTKKLEGVKVQVANVPQTDAEFLRLRSKLESCHNEGLEAMCHALQQEVDHLQQQRWQKQLQRQSNQSGSNPTSSTQPQDRNVGPRKAPKRQIHLSTFPYSSQSNSVNTWSSFHVTHSSQRVPSPQDVANVSTNGSRQVRLPPSVQCADRPPAAPSTVTQPNRAVSTQEEMPFRPEGVVKPNLAKLRRGAQDIGKEKPELQRPVSCTGTRQFNFRKSTPCHRPPSATAGSSVVDKSTASPVGDIDDDCDNNDNSSVKPRSSGLSQAPANAKRVHFKY